MMRSRCEGHMMRDVGLVNDRAAEGGGLAREGRSETRSRGLVEGAPWTWTSLEVNIPSTLCRSETAQ